MPKAASGWVSCRNLADYGHWFQLGTSSFPKLRFGFGNEDLVQHVPARNVTPAVKDRIHDTSVTDARNWCCHATRKTPSDDKTPLLNSWVKKHAANTTQAQPRSVCLLLLSVSVWELMMLGFVTFLSELAISMFSADDNNGNILYFL